MTTQDDFFGANPETTIKAISLWEPWATLVMCQAKLAETRHWKTHYRGDLLICAAKKVDTLAMQLLNTPEFQRALQPLWKIREAIGYPHSIDTRIKEEHLNFGKVVAKVNLRACVSTGKVFENYLDSVNQPLSRKLKENIPFGDYSDKRFVWLFEENIMTLNPFKVKGAQGFFDVPIKPDILKEIRL